jgi:phospholipid/cholesterol/gamma-HCH transport system substrate-binding protein
VSWWNVQVKVGIVVLIGFFLLILLLLNASNSPWSASGDLLTVTFSFVNDLRVGAAVQLAGVQIGKVTGIALSEDGTSVEVQMRVRGAFRRLRQGCKVEIGIIGFVGEAYINLTNGPPDNPLLQPTDLPLVGKDPIGISGLLAEAQRGLTQSIQLVETANQLLQTNQATINQSITELRDLIRQTTGTLASVAASTEQTVDTLNRIARENDFRFEQTFRRFNRLIDQLENDSILISSQVSDISRSVLNLINQNSASVEQILADLQESSANFRNTSQQLGQDLDELKSQLSNLATQSQQTIESETPKIDQLLNNLVNATEDLDELKDSFAQLLDKVQTGEGSLAKLLNEPEAFDNAQRTLRVAEETMQEIQSLSRTLNQQSRELKLLDIAWDYELRYLSFEESLHNELAILLLTSPVERYRLGVGVRNEDIDFEFQYGYDVTDHLRSRFGFMRSKVGLGLDLWLLSKRLGVTVEGTELTSGEPKLSAEATFRFLPYGHIILGAENLTDDISYTAGFRLSSINW